MLQFEIAGFTHKGTYRPNNQDGVMWNQQLLLEGTAAQDAETPLFAFVADGVGGSRRGELAATCILENITPLTSQEIHAEGILRVLEAAQQTLLEKAVEDPSYQGSATTLAGVWIAENALWVINTGDSDVKLWQNGKWRQLNQAQVMAGYKENPPITAYFGGDGRGFHPQINLCAYTWEPNTYLLISSDGLWDATDINQIGTYFKSGNPVQEISEELFRITQNQAARDNVSAILIRRK